MHFRHTKVRIMDMAWALDRVEGVQIKYTDDEEGYGHEWTRIKKRAWH
jgi:hypothetical protein